jgi:hypothetical protein
VDLILIVAGFLGAAWTTVACRRAAIAPLQTAAPAVTRMVHLPRSPRHYFETPERARLRRLLGGE